MNIYVARNKETLGPYTVEEVRARINSGSFTEADFGWHEGLTDWRPLYQLVVPSPLKDSVQSATPPKSSGFAKTSFLIAMVGIGAWLVILVVAVFAESSGIDETSPLMIMIGFCVLIFLAVNLAGIVFGLIALPKPASNKWMAISGLTVNVLELVFVIALLVVGMT